MTQPSSTQPGTFPPGSGPIPDLPGVEVEHEFHDLPGRGRFHVARAGDRSLPAILLVHGFPQHWLCWGGVIGELSKEAHLIAPDLRGAGWSSLPTGPDAAKKGELAADLLGLLDAMGIDQIAVVGHDWGGFVSQILTLDHPERVRRLLALSIPPVVPTPRPPVRSLLRMYYQLVFSAPFSDKIMARGGGARIAKGMRQDVRQRENFTREDAELYARPYADPQRAKLAQTTYRSFILGDAKKIYARTAGQRFQVPVRFILSAYDAYIPPEFAEHVGRTGDEVDGFVQSLTGHFLPDEDPKYTADQIRAWVLPHAQPIGG